MKRWTFTLAAVACWISAAILAACGNSTSPGAGMTVEATPGTVLASKTCTLVAAGVPVPVPANSCWQVTYRTTDTQGKAVDTIATILVPDAAPVTGRVLVSYQIAEDGLTTDCAPSNELTKSQSDELQNIVSDLQQGWVVVVPDYEGPHSEYTAGIMAGHGVLDAIRAALKFLSAGLAADTKVAMEGYSGGALASGWAMELQAGYAPEINLVGVAEGGIPANIYAIARKLDGGAFSGVELAATIGLKRAYAFQFDLKRYLNAAGKAMEQDIGRMCIGQAGVAPDAVGNYPFRRLDEFTTIPNFNDFPPWKAILDGLQMGQRRPMARSVFMFHVVTDEGLPIAPVDELRATYCSQGVHVLYECFPAGDHVGGAVPFFAQALPYLQAAFAEATPVNPLATSCN